VLPRELKPAYASLRELLRNSAPMDATNYQILARGNRIVKNYAESGTAYSELLRRIDFSQYPDLFWQTQLERAQMLVEGYPTDKDSMSRLLTLLKNLRIQDPTMGGLYSYFDAVQAAVEKNLGGQR
jgi:hypothetical protein